MKKVALTETGKRKAESSTGGATGLRYAIIEYIENRGDSSINELADGTNANASEVKAKVNQLVSERWLTWTGDLEEDSDWD